MANAKTLAETPDAGRFRIVSGGTDTHLMLVDVFSKGVRGKEAEKALDEACITVNKNAIPFDTNPPLNPSGIRLGSPAVTTRGFGEAEMREVGNADRAGALRSPAEANNLAACGRRVEALTERFPLYALEDSPAQRSERPREAHYAAADRIRRPPHPRLRLRHLHPQSSTGAGRDRP